MTRYKTPFPIRKGVFASKRAMEVAACVANVSFGTSDKRKPGGKPHFLQETSCKKKKSVIK